MTFLKHSSENKGKEFVSSPLRFSSGFLQLSHFILYSIYIKPLCIKCQSVKSALESSVWIRVTFILNKSQVQRVRQWACSDIGIWQQYPANLDFK